MKNSFELTKANPPQNWFTPFLWGVVLFFGAQFVFGAPMFIAAKSIMPGHIGEMIAALFSFSFSIIGALLVNKYVNKRTVSALGFHKEKWLAKYGLGILIGLGLIAFVVGSSMLLGTLSVKVSPAISWGVILALLGGFMIQGMAEEVVCRGYVQNGLRTKWGIVAVMFAQAAFFTVLHSLNPGMEVLPIVNLFAYGLFMGVLFYYTDSIWVVGGVHTIWNFMLGVFMGIEVSGQIVEGAVFVSTLDGAGWLTGGKFGLEGSILTTAVMLLGSVITYALIKQKAKTGESSKKKIADKSK